MSQYGQFLRKVDGGYMHWCEGCKTAHYIAVSSALSNGAKWTFNGNRITPTFNPSVKIVTPGTPKNCCHYFLKDGRIEYCGDSTHKFAGKIIPLIEWSRDA